MPKDFDHEQDMANLEYNLAYGCPLTIVVIFCVTAYIGVTL